jgi:hypothetical protein
MPVNCLSSGRPDRALGRPPMRRKFIVPQNKDLKRLVRARMTETGERYTQALAAVLARTTLDPVPAPWFMAGSTPDHYEVGLLPATVTADGPRVVQLRLTADAPDRSGFGTLMQSITASLYVGRKVRFSAMIRPIEVAGWAGLWMRVDTAYGAVEFDNMQDRPIRESADWARPEIVLSVPGDSISIHFGVLLDGAGAVEFSQARFEGVDDSVPVTSMGTIGLPHEPQGLDFDGADQLAP